VAADHAPLAVIVVDLDNPSRPAHDPSGPGWRLQRHAGIEIDNRPHDAPSPVWRAVGANIVDNRNAERPISSCGDEYRWLREVLALSDNGLHFAITPGNRDIAVNDVTGQAE
jgi:hypothetical protein